MGERAMTGLSSENEAHETPGTDPKVTGLVDKGPDKGALIYSERTLVDKAAGAKLATLTSTSFGRGDGGSCGAPHWPSRTCAL